MTVTYTLDVSNSRISSFLKLLFRWRGSLWKSVYQELLIWLACFFALSSIYLVLLDEDQQKTFEAVAHYCGRNSELIPLTFMLGFFVQLVITRWWDMFMNFGWIENFALFITGYLNGNDERSRMMRRSMVRYLALLQTMVFRDISLPVRRRFPTFDTLVTAGYLNEEEKNILENVVISKFGKYWVPVQWCMTIVRKARQEGKITSDHAVQDIFERLREFRVWMVKLTLFDWVPVPLVYTQVVFLTVRIYFLIALMGRQFLRQESELHLWFPALTIVQFVFYMGWMKVAEALVNPMGDDDDDLEANFMLDRNLSIGLAIADWSPERNPTLTRDAFWKDGPQPLYSAETVHLPLHPLIGSAAAASMQQGKHRDSVTMVPRDNVTGQSQFQPPVDQPIPIRRGTIADPEPNFLRKNLSRLFNRPSVPHNLSFVNVSPEVGMLSNQSPVNSKKSITTSQSSSSILNEIERPQPAPLPADLPNPLNISSTHSIQRRNSDAPPCFTAGKLHSLEQTPEEEEEEEENAILKDEETNNPMRKLGRFSEKPADEKKE